MKVASGLTLAAAILGGSVLAGCGYYDYPPPPPLYIPPPPPRPIPPPYYTPGYAPPPGYATPPYAPPYARRDP